MILILIQVGLPYNYVLWEIGIWEFNLLFTNAVKVYLRNLQMQSLSLAGTIGSFFSKKDEKTFLDHLQEQIEEIAGLTEHKEKRRKGLFTEDEFHEKFVKPWSKVIPVVRGLPPGGLPKE